MIWSGAEVETGATGSSGWWQERRQGWAQIAQYGTEWKALKLRRSKGSGLEYGYHSRGDQVMEKRG